MMPRAKKATKEKQVVPNIEVAQEIPSDVCKAFMIKHMVTFYESETIVSLDNKYIRHQEALKRRWWMDPSIAYLHRRDANVDIIPNLSCKLEEYARTYQV